MQTIALQWLIISPAVDKRRSVVGNGGFATAVPQGLAAQDRVPKRQHGKGQISIPAGTWRPDTGRWKAARTTTAYTRSPGCTTRWSRSGRGSEADAVYGSIRRVKQPPARRQISIPSPGRKIRIGFPDADAAACPEPARLSCDLSRICGVKVDEDRTRTARREKRHQGNNRKEREWP